MFFSAGKYVEILVIWSQLIKNMSVLRNFAPIVIRNKLQAIFTTWIH